MMFLVILAVIGGNVVADGPTVPGCYTPYQWEGVKINVIGIVQGGIPRVLNVLTLISYDEKHNTIAYNISSSVNGNTQYTRQILDYNQGKQYDIDLNTQSCDVVALSGKFNKFQLPSYFKPKGKFYYGVGKQTVPAVAFGTSINADSTNVTILMTAENCLPIGETVVRVSGSDADMQTISFVDITLGIKDRAVFRPPDYCTGANVKSIVKNVHPEPKSYSVFNVL